MKVKQEVANLKQTDIYSLLLFAMFKLRDIPEYSAISELAYVLDKENLLRLCEFFGGVTIKIPTIDELESMVYSLVLYQYVDVEGMGYDKAVELVGAKSCDLRKVKTGYQGIKKVLENYSFGMKDE